MKKAFHSEILSRTKRINENDMFVYLEMRERHRSEGGGPSLSSPILKTKEIIYISILIYIICGVRVENIVYSTR